MERALIDQEIADLYTRIELIRLTALRAVTKAMHGQLPWPEVPIGKLLWSTVSQDLAETALHALGPDGLPEDESLYATHKQQYERYWQQKINQQLAFIPGVIVGINAELNPEIKRQQNGVKFDIKPFAVSTTDVTKDATTASRW